MLKGLLSAETLGHRNDKSPTPLGNDNNQHITPPQNDEVQSFRSMQCEEKCSGGYLRYLLPLSTLLLKSRSQGGAKHIYIVPQHR